MTSRGREQVNIGTRIVFIASAVVAWHVLLPGADLGPGARCAETAADGRRAAEGVLETRATRSGAALPQRVVRLSLWKATTGCRRFLFVRAQLHRCLEVSGLQMYMM